MVNGREQGAVERGYLQHLLIIFLAQVDIKRNGERGSQDTFSTFASSFLYGSGDRAIRKHRVMCKANLVIDLHRDINSYVN